jgi:hypothetical protein
MDKGEAKALLQAEMEKYGLRGYLSLRQLVGDIDAYEVRGPSGTQYQFEVQAVWDARPNGNLRVIGSIDDGGLLSAFAPLTDSFILAPGGEFLDD